MDKHESQIVRDEHNADLNAKKVSLVSAATIYAVTSGGGNSTVFLGDVAKADGIAFSAGDKGVPAYGVYNTDTLTARFGAHSEGTWVPYSVDAGANIRTSLWDGNAQIATTSAGSDGVNNASRGLRVYSRMEVFNGTSWDRLRGDTTGLTLGNGINNIGFATVNVVNLARTITGNLTISDSKSYIGLTTTTLGGSIAGIGFTTIAIGTGLGVYNSTKPTLTDGQRGDWQLTSRGAGIVALFANDTGTAASFMADNVEDSAASATANKLVVMSRNYVWDGSNYDRIPGNSTDGMTVNLGSNNDVLNAGTTKTLVTLPIGLGNNSLSTLAVPTNAQRINVTQLILNSDATTSIAIKSGVTYLTGNASLAVKLSPTGGFVMNGSPDSPVWIGLPSGAIVIEKRDIGIVSSVAGHFVYYDG